MLAISISPLDYKDMSLEAELNTSSIYRAFSETSHGNEMAGILRYERYNLDGMSNEEWIQLLGKDVNGLTHLKVTEGLTESFIRYTDDLQPGLLNGRESALLKAGAGTHDWGERFTGDITCSDKTDADEAEEKSQVMVHIEDLYEGNADEIKELIREALGTIVFSDGDNEKLKQIFNAIERVGYVRTALRAAQHVTEGRVTPKCSEGLRWLIADVFANHIAKLDEYASEYAAVDLYLTNQHSVISEAFKLVGHEEFFNYTDKAQRSQKIQEFCDALSVWFERAARLHELRKI